MNNDISNRKVLVFSGARGDTRRYRAFHLYQQLCLAGFNCVLSDITNPLVIQQASTSNLAIIHRAAFNSTVRKVIEKIRTNHGTVLFDTDDLIFDQIAFDWIDSPDFSDPIREKFFREHLDLQRKTLEMADVVLVSTDYLAEQVKRLGKPAWVHRNAFSLELGAFSAAAWRSRQPDPNRVIIGYSSGTPTHNRDFALIEPALKIILNQFPQAEIRLIGCIKSASDWGSFNERVQYFPLVPWRDLPGLLSQLDINLAPLLTSNPFSQSKSEIKYMEAGLVGVPTIASPTDSYRFAIQSGKNGLLANTQEEWIQHMANLITDSKQRRDLGEAARKHVLKTYSPIVRASQLQQRIMEICPDVNIPTIQSVIEPKEPQKYFIPTKYEQHPNLLELGFFYIRLGNLRTLIGMTWIQVRRWLSPIFPFY